MKIIIYILLSVSILMSCSEPACMYSQMIETTYNYNKGAASFNMGNDTLNGCFFTVKNSEQTIATTKDKNSPFKLSLNKSDSSMDLTTVDNKTYHRTQENGHAIRFDMVSDTLIIQYLPTDKSDPNKLLFGFEYRFVK